MPADLSEAFVMHTVTDQIREHFAGAIPAGEGEVWNSSAVARYKLPGPYLPYIFVGGSPRGLALFSDNDQGCAAHLLPLSNAPLAASVSDDA